MGGLASGLGLALLVCVPPAEAAVRRCAPMIVGPERTAPVEATARRLALEAWQAEARRFGPAFTSWRLALTRSVVCHRRAGPLFACSARAAPCGISQMPDKNPPGLPASPRPKKRLIEA